MLHSEGLEKGQGHRVLDLFGASRFLRVGSTHVQLHSQENVIYLTFSQPIIYNLTFNFLH